MDSGRINVIVKSVIVLFSASLLMGNKGCEKQAEIPVKKVRELKKRIEISKITAPNIQLPGGGQFDFQFVANAQLYDVLMETGKFTMPYNQPVASVVASPGGVSKVNMKTSSSDKNLQSAWLSSFKTVAAPPADVACLLNMPQAYIGGSVRSFEMVSGGGLSIGFGPGGAFSTSTMPSASVMISKAQLDVGMVAYSPIRKRLLAAGDATAKQTKVDLNLTINFGNFSLGPKYFFQSPLSGVTKKALRQAADNLITNLSVEPWTSRVRANADTHVMVEGGLDVGLVKGDILEVYGEDHEWEGLPCKSKYLGSFPTETPISVIKITAVSDAYSVGEVIEQTDWNPQVADIVKVRSLVDLEAVPVN